MSTGTTSSPLYELRIAGHKGYGLFAMQDIKAGTRIICEEALVTMPTLDDIGPLIKQLEALQSEQHEQYTELSYRERSVDVEHFAPLRAHLVTQHQYNGKALYTALENYIKMIAIYFSNVVQMGVKARWGHGLFLTYSRINHSCRPNLSNNYNATLGKLTVHATRDIKAGEELTTTYILNVRTKEQRQDQLERGWGFKCHCELCPSHGKDATMSEQRRERMFEIDQGLALLEAGSTFCTKLEALACAEELVELLKQEKIFGMDLAQTYRECSKYSLAEGMYSKALSYAKMGVEVERICAGEETEHLEREREGAKFWLRHVEGLVPEGEAVKVRMNEKREAKDLKKAEKKRAKKGGKGGR